MKISTKIKESFLYSVLKFIGLPVILFFRKYKTNKILGLNNRDKFYYPRNTLSSSHKYSVVVAVYRVEKYIDQMISSLLRQTLDFKTNIEVILIDDGSDDSSSDICKSWANKFPTNIKYFRKNNGGQGSARNLGLQHVTGDWVTFIDPDDMVDKNYFLNVDKALNENSEVDLISCNYIYYLEDRYQLKDTHPLNYKYRNGNRFSIFDENSNDIQLSSSTAFFKAELIRKHSIKFPEIRTRGEDLYFVNTYLIKLFHAKAIFLSDAIYWYRKRSDKTSTLDTSWENEETYSTRLSLYLEILELAKKSYDMIPLWLQKTFIYELSWELEKFLNNGKSPILTSKRLITDYTNLLKNILKFIDSKTITNCNQKTIHNLKKAALIGVKDKSFEYCLLSNISHKKFFEKSITLTFYYGGKKPNIDVFVDHRLIKPQSQTIKDYHFFDEILFTKYKGKYFIGKGRKIIAKVNNIIVLKQTVNLMKFI